MIEVTDYLKPDLDEIWGILPHRLVAPFARWAERRWPHGRPTLGQHVRTTTVSGYPVEEVIRGRFGAIKFVKAGLQLMRDDPTRASGLPQRLVAVRVAVRLAGRVGIIDQALRDVVAWVEHDVPPAVMYYSFTADNALVLPPTAEERGGIQPVVTASADGETRAAALATQAGAHITAGNLDTLQALLTPPTIA